jgi:cytosine/adenosine deaminase-related metal-dependent hydrolase
MTERKAAHPFQGRLDTRIAELGGMWNAHLHLDRAGTLDEIYLQGSGHQILETSYISLLEKHSLIKDLHRGPAYETQDLVERANAYLDILVATHTTHADTLVDVTADGVDLSALETFLEIKQKRSGDIDLRVGAYSPLGFTDSEPERWELFVRGAERADFIGSLPEADDTRDYPKNIGFYEHCRRVLELSRRLGKLVHIHVDQRNEPSECGTEQLIQAVREYGAPTSESGEPMLWAIHLISPSTYENARFEKLLAGLVECNIGVVCCPSAALGMRQLRPLATPTYNSIPRILEMISAGVHVRLGSDNIADICSPSTTADLRDEVFILSAALRFYHIGVLAKLACGAKLDAEERELVRDHLDRNDLEMKKVIDRLNP